MINKSYDLEKIDIIKNNLTLLTKLENNENKSELLENSQAYPGNNNTTFIIDDNLSKIINSSNIIVSKAISELESIFKNMLIKTDSIPKPHKIYFKKYLLNSQAAFDTLLREINHLTCKYQEFFGLFLIMKKMIKEIIDKFNVIIYI